MSSPAPGHAFLVLLAVGLIGLGCGEDPEPPLDDDDDDSPIEVTSGGPYEFDAAPLSTVEVHNSLGGATVIGEEGRSSVEVSILPSDSAGLPPKRLAEGIEVVIEASGSQLRVAMAGTLPEGTSHADISVLAPRSLDYSLTLVEGDAQVSGMQSAGEVRIDEGALTGIQLQGNLGVTVGVGDIDLDVALDPWGSLEVALGTGTTRVQIPSTTSAQLEAIASDGDVYLSGLELAGVHLEGQALGVLGSGEGNLLLSAASGDIHIEGVLDD